MKENIKGLKVATECILGAKFCVQAILLLVQLMHSRVYAISLPVYPSPLLKFVDIVDFIDTQLAPELQDLLFLLLGILMDRNVEMLENYIYSGVDVLLKCLHFIIGLKRTVLSNSILAGVVLEQIYTFFQ